jgi:flagellar biosynthetic protein FlhB
MGRAERTEPATPERRRRARREGNFPSSPVLVSAVQFAVFVAVAGSVAGEAWPALRGWFAEGLRLAFREATPAGVVERARGLGWSAAWWFGPALALVLAATLAAQLAVTRLGFSGARLRPQFSRLNGLARLGTLGAQNRAAFLRALLLLALAGWLAAWLAGRNLESYLRLPFAGARAGAAQIGAEAERLLRWASYVFLAAGAVDLWRQWRRYERELRMTKQEVREELRNQEGSPETKARVRRLQREFSRRRMMQQVPQATAVVVNPTHYAVALRYRPGEAGAPRVVAKGRNFLALRIRELAVRSGVPVVENAPLAQALYGSVEVGREIPPHLYRAVAEILAYLFQFLRGRAPR